VISTLTNFLIRKNEYQADKFAWSKGRGSKLQEALTLLFKKDKGDVCPDGIYSMFLHTHPDLR
jgi:Zn-dependent protease with chaperone function